MAAITFSTVQQALADALAAIAAVTDSPLADVPVRVMTYQNFVPDGDASRFDMLVNADLAGGGMVFTLGFPGSGPRDAAENDAVYLNLAPSLELHLNPGRNYADDGLNKDPHAILDFLLPRLIGRPATTGGNGGQKWHLNSIPVAEPAKTKLSLVIRINLTLPSLFTRT
jgi:hypothetical protein